MKRIALLLTALLLPAGAAAAQSLAFTGVTIIDVEEGTAEPGQTVVVSGHRISAVGETGTVYSRWPLGAQHQTRTPLNS